MLTELEDYRRPDIRIAGFKQDPESWVILPKPKNCRERKGKLYYQIFESDIIRKAENGDYLLYFEQGGLGCDLVGVKIGESDWHYAPPGKAMRVRMSVKDLGRYAKGKPLEIQVMGLNKSPKMPPSSTTSDYLVMGSCKYLI